MRWENWGQGGAGCKTCYSLKPKSLVKHTMRYALPLPSSSSSSFPTVLVAEHLFSLSFNICLASSRRASSRARDDTSWASYRRAFGYQTGHKLIPVKRPHSLAVYSPRDPRSRTTRAPLSKVNLNL